MARPPQGEPRSGSRPAKVVVVEPAKVIVVDQAADEHDALTDRKVTYGTAGKRSGELTIFGVKLDATKPRAGELVHPALDAATTGGKMLEFMRAMLSDEPYVVTTKDGEQVSIAWKHFNNPEHELGFEYKLDGTAHNKAKLKERFRGLAPGTHEWIPSNVIVKVIERARQPAENMVDGGAWIDAQNELRNFTKDIIYSPWPKGFESMAGYAEAIEGYAENAKDVLEEMAAGDETDASKLALQGHVGALYLEDDAKKIKKRDHFSDKWHEELRVRFEEAGSVEDAIVALKAFAEATVWDGQLEGLEDADAALIDASMYLDGAKKALLLDTDAKDNRKERVDAIVDFVDQGTDTVQTLLDLSAKQAVAFNRVIAVFEEAQSITKGPPK